MKTIKKIPVTVEFVEEMPFNTIQENVLYVNKKTCRRRHCIITIGIANLV
jgi:hypothetical protein